MIEQFTQCDGGAGITDLICLPTLLCAIDLDRIWFLTLLLGSGGLEVDDEHEQPPVKAVAAVCASSVSTASDDKAYLELALKRQLAYQLQQKQKDEKAKEQQKQ